MIRSHPSPIPHPHPDSPDVSSAAFNHIALLKSCFGSCTNLKCTLRTVIKRTAWSRRHSSNMKRRSSLCMVRALTETVYHGSQCVKFKICAQPYLTGFIPTEIWKERCCESRGTSNASENSVKTTGVIPGSFLGDRNSTSLLGTSSLHVQNFKMAPIRRF